LNGGGDQPWVKSRGRRSHVVLTLIRREDIRPNQSKALLGSVPE
jgi:hypothetical protein